MPIPILAIRLSHGFVSPLLTKNIHAINPACDSIVIQRLLIKNTLLSRLTPRSSSSHRAFISMNSSYLLRSCLSIKELGSFHNKAVNTYKYTENIFSELACLFTLCACHIYEYTGIYLACQGVGITLTSRSVKRVKSLTVFSQSKLYNLYMDLLYIFGASVLMYWTFYEDLPKIKSRRKRRRG